MNEDLEQRLRHDLSTLDELPLGDARAVASASGVASDRLVRRRRYVVTGVTAGLIGAGVLGVWAFGADDDQVATTATNVGAETHVAPVTTGPPDPVESDPVESDPVESDPLHVALASLGVDTATAPLSAIALGDAVLCGVEERTQGSLEESGIDENTRRCFLDRHIAAQPAVFVESFPTTEGDPIVIVWKSLADGTVRLHTDSTRDTYGSGSWESTACGRLTTRFPRAPEPLPPAYFGCDDDSIAGVDQGLDMPSAPMPDWVTQREMLPLCGYEVRISDRDIAGRTCFADAVSNGSPAEYAHVSLGDEGERSTRWFRAFGDGTFEVIEWRSADDAGGSSTWMRHRCTTIEFADEPDTEMDRLPLLASGSECTPDPQHAAVQRGTITGTLTMYGGPAPGTSVPIPGQVSITDTETGVTTTVAAGADGGFTADVPAGSYLLSATSPEYNRNESNCHRSDLVMLTPGATVTADIACAMR